MDHYIIKKIEANKFLVKSITSEGYSFSPKRFNEIKKITIQDQNLVENILCAKIDKEYYRLLSIIYSILNEDNTEEGDFLVGFTEIDRIENIIIGRYKDYINETLIKKYLKKLNILKKELMDGMKKYSAFLESDKEKGR